MRTTPGWQYHPPLYRIGRRRGARGRVRSRHAFIKRKAWYTWSWFTTEAVERRFDKIIHEITGLKP